MEIMIIEATDEIVLYPTGTISSNKKCYFVSENTFLQVNQI